jgi:predicted AlkP superfamily phosphohydrolase/phosphomutase
MTHADGPKVVMIGIDAGDIEVIRSSLHELPRFRELFAERPLLPLRSTAETLTSSVWPTFSTGTLPGEHGIYYPMQWDPERMTLRRVDADWLPYEPFWYELAREGKRVTVLDVPFSLPSRLECGVEVLNWGSQECLGAFQSNRSDLAREIRSRFGLHPMGEDVPVEEPAARLERLRGKLVAGARLKGELSRWLMETTEWDLFITVFAECHRAGHTLWPGSDDGDTGVPRHALLDVYRAVDQAVGHVLDGIDPKTTTVVVFSVHGMRANYTQEHFVLPVMERLNARYHGKGAPEEPAPASGFNPMRALRAALPARLQSVVAKALPDAARDWVVRRAFCGGLDWSVTPGFAVAASCEGYLRYNLAGRESEGMLESNSEAFHRYEDWLRACLLALEDASSGKRVVKDVVSSADLYPGPRCRYLPDMIVLWDEVLPTTEIRSDELGRFHGRLTTGRTGDHRPDGFAVVLGSPPGTPPLDHIVDFAGFVRSLLLQPRAA